MARTKKIKIGIKDIRDLNEGCTLWDTRISGFCARRRKSAGVFYALKYRTVEGRQRWYTIGRHGAPWTPDHNVSCSGRSGCQSLAAVDDRVLCRLALSLGCLHSKR